MKTDLDNELKKNGLKNTKHRKMILNILEKSSQPISAEQLFQEMTQKNISINLSTIYRTLDTLSDKKLITKLNIREDNKTLFEFNRKIHRHHLICLGCKKILAIDSCPLAGYEKVLENETNYTIEGHNLDIYGYCPNCQMHDS